MVLLRAPVYLFRDNLYPYKAEEKGVGCRLFLPSNFSTRDGEFPSREEVEEMVGYLERHKEAGDIGNLINSRRGTLSEDKISILELQAQGVRTPQTHYFSNLSELREFLGGNQREYVLKHRFGQEGRQFFRINEQNITNINHLRIKDFIVQELLDVSNEKRLIFFDDELLGARIIVDRHMPWEEEGKVGRKHITESYNPREEEVEDTKRILKNFDAIVGCIDWIRVNGKGRLYMEYNGVGTGWGKGPYPYNLNQTVAEKLKENFL
jgi:glutathione synthase/RimK-type ligase-like ATP-grasp enzyme